MNITLNIKLAVQAELQRQASASGQLLEAHAATLLEEAIQSPPATRLIPGKRTNRNRRGNKGLGKSLVNACAIARGLTDELDLTRTTFTWRPLEIE